MIRDFKKRETTLLIGLNKLRDEHEGMKHYLVKKTQEAAQNVDVGELHTKSFAKAMKFYGFSYWASEARGIKIENARWSILCYFPRLPLLQYHWENRRRFPFLTSDMMITQFIVLMLILQLRKTYRLNLEVENQKGIDEHNVAITVYNLVARDHFVAFTKYLTYINSI